jgi:hypothetical protein
VADEITINASLAYADSENADESLAIAALLATIATKKYTKHKMNVGITEEAVVLGECTSPGWAIFVNRDATNFIELRVATGGAKFAKMLPGECAMMRLGSGAQAPYAISDTSPCQMEYFLLQT